jgi:hypothetical protein
LDRPARLIALGASNLTRGFATVVNTARTAWSERLQIVAALGHGRSYGIKSRILFRSLPGILESGLWHHLSSSPAVFTRALITDVGNDVLYHVPVPTILDWIREVVARLRATGAEIVLTDLPIDSIRRLTPSGFAVFRSLLVPSCRLSLGEARERAEALNEGLVSLAGEQGLGLVRLRPEWYGLDPIHVRPRFWAAAWREILLNGLSPSLDAPGKALGGLRLYLAAPERRWLFGVEQRHAQPAVSTEGGCEVYLF